MKTAAPPAWLGVAFLAAVPLSAAQLPAEGEILGGQTRTFALEPPAGGAWRVVVRQLGLDLAVRALAPSGAAVAEADAEAGPWGVELLTLTAPASVELRAVPPIGRGRYRISVERVAAESAAAERLLTEAATLLHGEPARRREALAKLETAAAGAREARDDLALAVALQRLAAARVELGEARAAFEPFNEARAVWDVLGERALATVALHGLGQAAYYGGEPRLALERMDAALAEWRQQGAQAGEVDLLGDRGSALNSLGDCPAARASQEQALALARAPGDQRREGEVLSNLATTYLRLGETNLALEAFDLALPLRRAAGDRAGEAAILSNLAFSYQTLGDDHEARRRYEQVLPVWRELGDARGEAVALNNLGEVHSRLGDTDAARRLLEQALDLRRKRGDRQGQAYTLVNLAMVERELGDRAHGMARVTTALELLRQVGDRLAEAATLGVLALLRTETGQPETALPLLDQATEIQDTIRQPYSETLLLWHRGRTERALGALDAARSHLTEAVDKLEVQRQRLGSPDQRATFLGRARLHYEALLDVLADLHAREPAGPHAAEALGIAERARARSLLDLLSEARVDVRLGADPDLLAQERALRARLGQALGRHMRLAAGAAPAEQLSLAARELETLSAESDRLAARLRAKSPRYADLTRPEPLDLEALRARVLDDDTLLLEYSLQEPRSYLWAVTRTSLEMHVLPGRDQLEGLVRRVYAAWSERPHGRGAQDTTAELELSRSLLGPVAGVLAGRRLLIVPDGALVSVPFAALPDPSSPADPLVKRHELVGAPSASVLAALREPVGARRRAAHTLALLADPVFSADDARARRSSASRGAQRVALARLPFSRREALAIAALLPPAQARVLLDFEASRERALSADVAGAALVHFATHGFFDAEHARLSGLVLSLLDAQGRPREGLLSTSDVFNLELAADLVVLSGCRTGLGEEIRGEGLLGLVRAFMYAGAPRVLASLWTVDDAATAELMAQLYRGLLQRGERPAAALRAAQLKLLEQQRFRQPYFWAAFGLQGDWR